jgi:hypothetical protein
MLEVITHRKVLPEKSWIDESLFERPIRVSSDHVLTGGPSMDVSKWTHLSANPCNVFGTVREARDKDA